MIALKTVCTSLPFLLHSQPPTPGYSFSPLHKKSTTTSNTITSQPKNSIRRSSRQPTNHFLTSTHLSSIKGGNELNAPEYVWTVSGHIDLINVCQARCFHGPPFVLSFTCLTYRTWPEVSCLRVDFLAIAFCCLLGNCLLHGGLLCVFIAIFREYCFNLKGVMQGQTEMLRNELTPTPLLLPPLCVSVCLSLYACPIHSYFIPFLFADLLP